MKFNTIFWDFDGVIVQSNEIREQGFKEVLRVYPIPFVVDLIKFHRNNGGLSRYVKFRYFFEVILNQTVSDETIQKLASKFSLIMKSKLIDKRIIIESTYQYILKNYNKIDFHIVSGSDEKELNYLCQKLGLDKYFISIKGSPTHKNHLVSKILADYQYDKNQCILIGDSINDFEAANKNEIGFWGFNNLELKVKFPKNYIINYSSLEK